MKTWFSTVLSLTRHQVNRITFGEVSRTNQSKCKQQMNISKSIASSVPSTACLVLLCAWPLHFRETHTETMQVWCKNAKALVQRSIQLWWTLKTLWERRKMRRMPRLRRKCLVKILRIRYRTLGASASKSKSNGSFYRITILWGSATRICVWKLRRSIRISENSKENKDLSSRMHLRQASYSGLECNNLAKPLPNASWSKLSLDANLMKRRTIVNSQWLLKSSFTLMNSVISSITRQRSREVCVNNSTDIWFSSHSTDT